MVAKGFHNPTEHKEQRDDPQLCHPRANYVVLLTSIGLEASGIVGELL